MNEKNQKFYTNQLQAGLGLIEETKTLLTLWDEDITSSQLHEKALQSGYFADKTSRRLRNIVTECFKPRYLVDNGNPVRNLKLIINEINQNDLLQFFLLFTCRANLLLRDFISEIYWDLYNGGYSEINNFHAENFINNALDLGKTEKRWEPSTIKRQTSYLMGCCIDFGLLERNKSSSKKIKPFYLCDTLKLYLSYDLYFSGFNNNQIINHQDWRIFGFSSADVLNNIKKLSMLGHLRLQSAGGVFDISWNYKNMKELLNVIHR